MTNYEQWTSIFALFCVGYSDPYVKVGFGNQRGKTKVKWKTLNPTWNETLNFMIPSGQPPNTILLIVRDKDPIFDDKLG